MAFLNETGLRQVWDKIKTKINSIESTISDIDEAKVDKVSGKGLSTNDYTTAEKEKLAGIATGATKVIVDNALSSTSENAIQNKVVANMKINIDDSLGETIKELSISGKTITYTKGDGTTGTITTQDTNTTYSAGTGLSLDGTKFSVKTGYTTSDKNYKVQADSNGNLYVNVPWTDTTPVTSVFGRTGDVTLTKSDVTTALGYTPPTTDTNTTYTAGTGLSLSGTTFNHSNSITAGSVGSAQSPSHGGTFAIPKITYDAQGHITGATTVNITLPGDNNTDTKVTQTVTTSNASYPLLLAPSGQTATATTTSYFDSGVTLNPSTNTIAANISGNAGTTTVLANARTLTIGSTGKTFDGSADVSWSLSEIGATVSNTITGGTTNGPTIKTTVNGVEGSAVTIPSASLTASGIITTGAQEFKGLKTFHGARLRIDDNASKTSLYYNSNSGTILAETYVSQGDNTNITEVKYGVRLRSPNSTPNTSTTGKSEFFIFPAPNAGRTADAYYNVLTTKNTITVPQGGTGATNKSGARTNLGITSGTSLPSASGSSYSAGDIFILY